VKNSEKPIANPFVVLREEFDEWAVLFDPDTGKGFGLSPTGVYLWKLLDGEHPAGALPEEIRTFAEQVPEEAGDHVRGFVDELIREGLAAFDLSQFGLGVGLRKTADSIHRTQRNVPTLSLGQ
jgi:SynChlorMet cassette protein ScmD